MANTYDTYLKTYEKNIFGIDQRQYIVLINYLMFLLVALMIVGAMEGKFRVKNIGKDGIELERVIEETRIPLDYVVPNSQTASLGKGRVQQFLDQYHKGNHH